MTSFKRRSIIFSHFLCVAHCILAVAAFAFALLALVAGGVETMETMEILEKNLLLARRHLASFVERNRTQHNTVERKVEWILRGEFKRL